VIIITLHFARHQIAAIMSRTLETWAVLDRMAVLQEELHISLAYVHPILFVTLNSMPAQMKLIILTFWFLTTSYEKLSGLGMSMYVWNNDILEKLTVSQLVKKFPAFYGTWRFITAFTRARHLSLSK
jgi:hypothetical protein